MAVIRHNEGIMNTPWQKLMWMLAGLAIFAGLGLRVYALLQPASNYPFPSFWSESGRLYEAYQVYAPLLGDERAAWPWLDPGRAILEGLVWLIPNSQIWMYRLWIVMLSLASIAATAVASAWGAAKFTPADKLRFWLFAGWGILFLNQGPVYYHTLPAILPVLWFYDREKPIRNLWLVIICSAWAGLTRVNWFAMPAITATVLYLVTEPKQAKTFFGYTKHPFIWGILGSGTAVLVYAFSTAASGNPSILAPEMQYGFFRSKLWPNNGFSLGLLPGIGLATLAPTLLSGWMLARNTRHIHWLRTTALLGILLVLFAGSTYISLRAGGGYDLHNYDTFLVTLLLVTHLLGWGTLATEQETSGQPAMFSYAWVLLALLVIPLFFAIRGVPTRWQPPEEQAQQAIQDLNAILGDYEDDRVVLYIDYRHFVLYGLVSPSLNLPEYEKIELMEMAMANNRPYFDQFRLQTEQHEFGLIITAILWDGYKEIDSEPFWYENNVWSDTVAAILLKEYEPIYINREVNLAVYAPKGD